MKVSASLESVQALRDFAIVIPQAIDHLSEESDRLLEFVASQMQNLGIRANLFWDYVNRCTAAAQDIEDACGGLVAGLNQTADLLEEYIVKDFNKQSENIDFSKTMSTEEELGIIRELDNSGEESALKVDFSKEEPLPGRKHLPTQKTGDFSGVAGNSLFIPNDSDARAFLAEYGTEGVEYKDGYPDFTPFAHISTPWGDVFAEVSIGHMTSHRRNPKWEYGRRTKAQAYDPSYDLGNFNQADLALAEKLSLSESSLREMKRDVLCRQIAAYRKENKLTWHECADGNTMLLIPTIIHDACKHSGGVSFEKLRAAYGDVTLYIPEEW